MTLASILLDLAQCRTRCLCRAARLVCVAAGACMLAAWSAEAQTVVVYPRGRSGEPGYAEAVLDMALRRSGGNYQLRLSTAILTQGRALVLLQVGEGIDVVNYMTSADRETKLLPVRFPIDKGLLGMRLLLIHKSQLARFGAVTHVEQLKALLAGQGSDWPDTDILRENGFRVYATTNYDGLFKMLNSGRISYFPRSISEIWSEAERHADSGLVVEPSLMLHYPTGSYFFVNKKNVKLAADIGAGLDAMLADGSFDKLFNQYFGVALKKARLETRSVFELRNPLLPPQTTSEPKPR